LPPTDTAPARASDLYIAVALCIAAGIVDAVGFLHAGVFAANMTGNTVLAAISLAQLDVAASLEKAATIAAFFFGAMLGRLLTNASKGQPWPPLTAEAAVLCAVAFAHLGHEWSVLLLAFAMGLQATAITRFRGAAVSTVVLTSTLARIAEAALDLVAFRHRAREVKPSLHLDLLGATWVSYALGAMLGVVLLNAALMPVLASAMIVATVAWHHAPQAWRTST